MRPYHLDDFADSGQRLIGQVDHPPLTPPDPLNPFLDLPVLSPENAELVRRYGPSSRRFYYGIPSETDQEEYAEDLGIGLEPNTAAQTYPQKRKKKPPLSLNMLPIELQSEIFSHLTQPGLLVFSQVSKLHYRLSIPFLYSRLYLNDTHIAISPISPQLYHLARKWSWFQLDSSGTMGDNQIEANFKLGLLLRSLTNNPKLGESIVELRMNWDLNVNLQVELLKVIRKDTKGALRAVENITEERMNLEGLTGDGHVGPNGLISVDIPPPNLIQSYRMPPEQYFVNIRRYLQPNITESLRHLTLFLDPLIVMNTFFDSKAANLRPYFKLKLSSFKMHCRQDAYPAWVYDKSKWVYNKLTDIFDVDSLRELTVISWYDTWPSVDIFKFNEWSAFVNLEDITLIAVIFDDELVSKMVRSCRRLRRLKLDFGPKFVEPQSQLYSSVMDPVVHRHLEFLEWKCSISAGHVIDCDMSTFEIISCLRCPCSRCKFTFEHLIIGKLFGYNRKIRGEPSPFGIEDLLAPQFNGTSEEYALEKAEMLESGHATAGISFLSQDGRDFFRSVNVFDHVLKGSLFPYSKAVDRYPGVRTGDDTVEDFIRSFNALNQTTPYFEEIEMEEFPSIVEYIIHSWKPDLSPYVKQFPKLRFIVLNDLAFYLTKGDRGQRIPMPVYFSEGYVSNF